MSWHVEKVEKYQTDHADTLHVTYIGLIIHRANIADISSSKANIF